MEDMPDFVEIGRFETPLARFIKQYEQEGDGEQILEFLYAAQRISENKTELAKERESIRRNLELLPEELEHLTLLAEQAGEESYNEQYAMMEAIQAAAIPNCNLLDRSKFSMELAVAAKLAKQFERARQSYTDVVEGVQIFGRFFSGDESAVANAEDSARRGWDAVKSEAEQPLEIFDPAMADPAQEWMDLMLWNTDSDSGGGLLAQIDATMRLALRLEHWVDNKGQQLGPQVEQMCSHYRDLGGDKDSAFLAARCLVTFGDALIEVGQWEFAAQAHQNISSMAGVGKSHPLGMHATIQEGYCYMMSGDSDRCRAQLNRVDKNQMETLGELIVTVSAELARYCALDYLCERSLGKNNLADAREHVGKLLQRVAIIVSREPTDRTGYLRNLFFSVLARDVDSIIAAMPC